MIESLEPRQLFLIMHTGGGLEPATSLAGSVFFDKDRNGLTQDRLNDTDKGVAGVGIYLDANRNGKFDAGEPSGKTNKVGNYLFTNLTPAQVEQPVRPLLKAGQSVTTAEDQRAIGIWNLERNAYFAIHTPILSPLGGYPDGARSDVAISNVRVYVDFNRNGTRDKGEPVGYTKSAESPLLLNVTPGKYRLRMYAPDGYRADRRYVEVHVGERETRTWALRMTATSSLNILFYKDTNKNGRRDSVEPPVLWNRWLEVKAPDVHLFTGGYTYEGTSSDPVIHIRNLPRASLKVTYEKYHPGSTEVPPYPEAILATIDLPIDWASGTTLEFAVTEGV